MPNLSLIVTLLIVAVMIISILIGFIRGYKRGIYCLITRIIFWVSFFLLSSLFVSSRIWESAKVYAFVDGIVDLPDSYNTLIDVIIAILANVSGISQEALKDEAVVNTLLAAAQALIKLVFLIIWAIVYFLLNLLVYNIFFRSMCTVKAKDVSAEKHKQEKYVKKHGNESPKIARKIKTAEKQNERRKINKRFGLIPGVVNGLLSCFIILSLINSLMVTIPDLSHSDNITASTDGNDKVEYNSIYDYIVANYPQYKGVVDYIAEYQQSNLANVTSLKINGKRADTLFVDAIMTGKSKDYTVALREEIQNVVTIATYAFQMTNGFNMDSINWYALNLNQQESLKQIFLVLSQDNLIKNLGSTAIALALTLDAVKQYVPQDLELEININMETELTKVADMVAMVYSLQGNDTDLSKLDYTNLDPKVVKELLTTFGSLQSFQIAAEIGSYYAVDNFLSYKDENGNITNQEELQQIKEKLADIVWEEDVADISNLYERYQEVARQIEASRDEEGKANLFSAFSKTEETSFNNVVDTIMETHFMMNLYPDIVDIVKDKYIPAEYADLISPNIQSSLDFGGELKTLFSLVKQISDNGNEDLSSLSAFNFESLGRISTDTIMHSELLSYAMIKIFIDASNNQGLAGDSLGKFISVPSHLQKSIEQNDKGYYMFDKSWYDTVDENGNVIAQGELHIMLDTVKNVGSQLKVLNYPLTSLSNIIDAIVPSKILSSEVLQFTLSKYILESSGNFVYVPRSAIDTSITEKQVIDKEELISLIDTFKNDKIVPIRKLLKYYSYENNEKGAEIKYEDIDETTKYVAEFNGDTKEILSSFLTDELYDPEVQDETNLITLFKSNILRTTISYYVNDYDEYIVIPQSNEAISSEAVFAKDGEGNQVIKDIDVLSIKECKNLLKTLIKLDINFDGLDKLSKDPMNELMNKFTKVNPETGEEEYNDTLVKSIFDNNERDYSEIMHATISRYIKKFAGDASSSFKLIIPDEALTLPRGIKDDSAENKYISSDEVVNLLKAVYYITPNVFDDEDFDVTKAIIENENIDKAFDSLIIRTSISNYINTSDSTSSFIVIPKDEETMIVAHNNGEEINVITETEISNLIDGLRSLKRETGLSGDNLFDMDKYSMGAINNAMPDLLASNILHASISKKLFELNADQTIYLGVAGSFESAEGELLVKGQYDTNKYYYVNSEEIESFFNSITLLVGDIGYGDIASSFDSSTTSKLLEMDANEFFNSNIIVSTMAVKVYDMLSSSSAISFLDEENTSIPEEYPTYSRYNLTKAELTKFYKAVTAFSSGSGNIDEIGVDFDKVIEKCKEDDELVNTLCDSNIMNYNILKYITTQNEVFNNMLVLGYYKAGYENDEEYSYHRHWTNTDTKTGDMNSLVNSLVHLYSDEEFKAALTDPEGDTSISVYANKAFIDIVTGDSVLCNSLPNIIKKLAVKTDNEKLNLALLYAPDKFEVEFKGLTEEDTYSNYKTFWRGTAEDRKDGELYKFFIAIESSNAVAVSRDSLTVRNSLYAMLDSRVTLFMTKTYMYTIASTYNSSMGGIDTISCPDSVDSNDMDGWRSCADDISLRIAALSSHL